MKACLLALATAMTFSATARAETPDDARARDVLETQLALITDPAAFAATLAPYAVISGNGSTTTASDASAGPILATLSSSLRSAAPVGASQVVRITSGRTSKTSNVLWLQAEVQFARIATMRSRHVHYDHTSAWLTELVLDDGKTPQVVALSFVSSSGTSAAGATFTTAPGPLATLLASPGTLADQLRDSPSTTVLLDTTPSTGRDARSLLAHWPGRTAKLLGAAEAESSTGTWGVVSGDLEIPASGIGTLPRRTHVTLLAVKDGSRWAVVALQSVDDHLLKTIADGPDLSIEPTGEISAASP